MTPDSLTMRLADLGFPTHRSYVALCRQERTAWEWIAMHEGLLDDLDPASSDAANLRSALRQQHREARRVGRLIAVATATADLCRGPQEAAQ